MTLPFTITDSDVHASPALGVVLFSATWSLKDNVSQCQCALFCCRIPVRMRMDLIGLKGFFFFFLLYVRHNCVIKEVFSNILCFYLLENHYVKGTGCKGVIVTNVH